MAAFVTSSQFCCQPSVACPPPPKKKRIPSLFGAALLMLHLSSSLVLYFMFIADFNSRWNEQLSQACTLGIKSV